jgi:hypothetical protein
LETLVAPARLRHIGVIAAARQQVPVCEEPYGNRGAKVGIVSSDPTRKRNREAIMAAHVG